MHARNAEFQQQLQEKNDEISKLQRELEILRRKVHIVSTCIRWQNRVHKSIRMAEMRLQVSLPLT